MRVSNKLADTGSETRCQGGASECSSGYRPFQRMELGVMPVSERSWGKRLGEEQREARQTAYMDTENREEWPS